MRRSLRRALLKYCGESSGFLFSWVFFFDRRFSAVLVVFSVLLSSPWAVGDTSIADITVGGIVPAYFSVTSRGLAQDLDLTPRVTVSNRTVATVHFKFNEDIQSLVVSSSTMSGAPEDAGGTPYAFGGGGTFRVGFKAGCATADPTYNTPFVLTNVGTDVKSALAGALINAGIEEDCELTTSYTGTNVGLPLAGRYEMAVRLTMISP
jgi:hypothetical protein